MKYAVIGTSWITEAFISAASTVPGSELHAVYSRSPEKAEAFGKKHGAEKAYSELSALANDADIDVVYIASPNRLHFEQSKLMLLNGKNVICEKPATTTCEQMEELIALAKEKKLVYCEAIMSIHTPAFSVLQKTLPELGRIRSAHLDFCQLSSKYPAYLAGQNPNIFNPELHTGCLMDIGVYNVYLAAALFGMPQEILSRADFLESGADSNGAAILKYENMTVSLAYSKIAQSYSDSEICGDKASVGIGSVSQLTGLTLRSKAQTKELVRADLSRDEVMSGEVRFVKRMTESFDPADAEYLFAVETALTVRKICDEIRRQNGFPF